MATPHDHLDNLLETARAGQIDEFRRLVNETMCINEIHPITHVSIVEMLASEGHDDIVRYLIDQGAGLDDACRGAAKRGNQALMCELIELGASIHEAVHGAANGGYTKLMWTLIRAGADRGSALEGAGENGDPTLIQALIESGAAKFHALVGAIKSGNHELIRSLMSYSKSSFLIHVAARYGRLTLLDELKAHCTPGDFPELLPRNLAEGGYEGPFLQHYGEQSECLAWGICGAALGGHVDFMNRLMEFATQMALLDSKTALKWAVYGASQKDHRKLVDHLIERGAAIEDALLGASLFQQTALVNTLIARGTVSGQLRKNIAIRAAAMSERDDIVMELLAEGASLDQALRGVCSSGTNIEMAKYLIKQGASPEWIIIGRGEGVGTGIFNGNTKSLHQLLPKPFPSEMVKVILKVAAESGNFGMIQLYLERLQPDQNLNQKLLNAAVSGAARGGLQTMVTSLLEMGAKTASAIEGAVEGDHRDLIQSLLPETWISHFNEYREVVQTCFKTAFALGRADQVQWMLLRYGINGCVFAVKTMADPNEVVQALAMIQNPDQQLDIARQAQVVDRLPAAKLVRRANVSPHIAAAAMKINAASLRYLSTLCFLNKPSIPKDAVKKLLSYVAASEGHQIPEREIPALMRASHVANSPEMRANVSSSGNCCIF